MGDALKYLLLAAGVFAGVMFARHAFTEGMQTVIASEPKPQQAHSDSPLMSQGCQLDEHLQYVNPLRCQMEMRQAEREGHGPLVFHADPIPTMTKAESEKAGGWFMLAAFAVPLSLAAAAVLGFLILRLPRSDFD
jgi:hypothetical protein